MRKSLAIVSLFLVGLAVSSCGNTIRGMGQDTASAIDATQNAGENVQHAAQR
ncbi:entericidin [Martelella sp. HB161492]|uniref:entericidin domain-containing protein n=1 Tax=Martelella sp. HB161492 TaxID=2720726 RepID=UPI0015902703|nr:entericidin [Martelella sp. HB161492]